MPASFRRLSTVCAFAMGLCIVGTAQTAFGQQPPPGYEPQAPQPQGPNPAAAPPPGYAPPGYAQPGYPPQGYGQPAYAPPGYYPPNYGYPTQMLGPKEMDYTEGQQVPAGYHLESHIRKGLVVGGIVTFGSAWLLSALFATVGNDANHDNEFTPLFIPVAGPFVTIGTAHASGAGTFWLVVDGVAQGGGLLMAVLGFAAQREVLVRNDLASGKLRLTPVQLGKNGYGLGLTGSL